MFGIILIRKPDQFLYRINILWVFKITLIGMEVHRTHLEISFQVMKTKIKFGLGIDE
jgi:hypothetical protein